MGDYQVIVSVSTRPSGVVQVGKKRVACEIQIIQRQQLEAGGNGARQVVGGKTEEIELNQVGEGVGDGAGEVILI